MVESHAQAPGPGVRSPQAHTPLRMARRSPGARDAAPRTGAHRRWAVPPPPARSAMARLGRQARSRRACHVAPPARARLRAPGSSRALASERPDTRRYTALECPGCGLRLVRQRVLHGLYCKACGPRRGMLVRAGQGARAAMIAWVTGRTIEASRTEIAEIG